MSGSCGRGRDARPVYTRGGEGGLYLPRGLRCSEQHHVAHPAHERPGNQRARRERHQRAPQRRRPVPGGHHCRQLFPIRERRGRGRGRGHRRGRGAARGRSGRRGGEREVRWRRRVHEATASRASARTMESALRCGSASRRRAVPVEPFPTAAALGPPAPTSAGMTWACGRSARRARGGGKATVARARGGGGEGGTASATLRRRSSTRRSGMHALDAPTRSARRARGAAWGRRARRRAAGLARGGGRGAHRLARPTSASDRSSPSPSPSPSLSPAPLAPTAGAAHLRSGVRAREHRASEHADRGARDDAPSGIRVARERRQPQHQRPPHLHRARTAQRVQPHLHRNPPPPPRARQYGAGTRRGSVRGWVSNGNFILAERRIS